MKEKKTIISKERIYTIKNEFVGFIPSIERLITTKGDIALGHSLGVSSLDNVKEGSNLYFGLVRCGILNLMFHESVVEKED